MYCSAGEMCSDIAGLQCAATGADLNRQQDAEVVVWVSLLLAMLRTNSFPTGQVLLWVTWDLFLGGTAVVSKPDSPQSIPLHSGAPQIMASEAA